MYLKITPETVRASLRAIASGRTPKLEPRQVARYLLRHGGLDEMGETATDDFVEFAARIFALPDQRPSF